MKRQLSIAVIGLFSTLGSFAQTLTPNSTATPAGTLPAISQPSSGSPSPNPFRPKEAATAQGSPIPSAPTGSAPPQMPMPMPVVAGGPGDQGKRLGTLNGVTAFRIDTSYEFHPGAQN